MGRESADRLLRGQSDSKVDATKVGIEGLSRYGKAALVTEAFDERVAVGLIGSSGAGGAKLYRHIFGETVENLAGGEYYWMAGNFMKYAAAEAKFGPMTTADLPVDSHELIALCARGRASSATARWRVATRNGSTRAAASWPAFWRGPSTGCWASEISVRPGNYLTDAMPPVGQLIGGELAWRQHRADTT